MKYFFELQVKQTKDDKFISQEKYIKKLLKRFDMDGMKVTITSMNPLIKVNVSFLVPINMVNRAKIYEDPSQILKYEPNSRTNMIGKEDILI